MSDLKLFSLGQFLKQKRQEAGLSQLEVSSHLGYSTPQFISNIERGLSHLPLYQIPKLAGLYGVPLDELKEVIFEEQKKIINSAIDAATVAATTTTPTSPN